jgi:NAD-specific glutamate dehydrogenase
MDMDRDKLKEVAEDAIEDFFEGIDSVIDNIVYKIVDEHKIEDEDDIDYLKAKVRLGILKWE